MADGPPSVAASGESRDLVSEMPFDAESRMKNSRLQSAGATTTASNVAHVTNIIAPEFICGPSNLPSIEQTDPVPNISINLVGPHQGHDDKSVDDAGNGNNVHFDSRRSSKVSQDMSINNIFSPIVYTTNLGAPNLAPDPMEENRRTSIAVLQNKVNNFQTNYKRKMTVNQIVKGWIAPADNAANLKLFGGLRAVQEEQNRSKSAGWIIHPFSNLR